MDPIKKILLSKQVSALCSKGLDGVTNDTLIGHSGKRDIIRSAVVYIGYDSQQISANLGAFNEYIIRGRRDESMFFRPDCFEFVHIAPKADLAVDYEYTPKTCNANISLESNYELQLELRSNGVEVEWIDYMFNPDMFESDRHFRAHASCSHSSKTAAHSTYTSNLGPRVLENGDFELPCKGNAYKLVYAHERMHAFSMATFPDHEIYIGDSYTRPLNDAELRAIKMGSHSELFMINAKGEWVSSAQNPIIVDAIEKSGTGLHHTSYISNIPEGVEGCDYKLITPNPENAIMGSATTLSCKDGKDYIKNGGEIFTDYQKRVLHGCTSKVMLNRFGVDIGEFKDLSIVDWPTPRQIIEAKGNGTLSFPTIKEVVQEVPAAIKDIGKALVCGVSTLANKVGVDLDKNSEDAGNSR